jgi:iron(III) transport system ATP-binding protein
MLTVTNLRKSFESNGKRINVVDGVTFSVGAGAFFTLLGPSGCGKSTTLRCIAGLEKVSSGTIEIDGEVVASETRHAEPNQRPISMVFQSYAIWPHMTVLENVMFPLSYRGSRGSGQDERRARGMEALRMVQLDHLADRDAPFLSGGQQQRVALARSLVVRPKLLLLDEPLSNLDAKLREEMRFEIKELTSRLGISTIYVTHDQAEALSMSDQIAVMSDGKILQVGSPREIYLEPTSPSVARIVGNVNVLKGTIAGATDHTDEVQVSLPSGGVMRCRRGRAGVNPSNVSVVFRPELVRVRLEDSSDGASTQSQSPSTNSMRAQVTRVDFTGDHLKAYLETSDGPVIAKLAPDLLLNVGSDVTLLVKAEHCVAQ